MTGVRPRPGSLRVDTAFEQSDMRTQEVSAGVIGRFAVQEPARGMCVVRAGALRKMIAVSVQSADMPDRRVSTPPGGRAVARPGAAAGEVCHVGLFPYGGCVQATVALLLVAVGSLMGAVRCRRAEQSDRCSAAVHSRPIESLRTIRADRGIGRS